MSKMDVSTGKEKEGGKAKGRMKGKRKEERKKEGGKEGRRKGKGRKNRKPEPPAKKSNIAKISVGHRLEGCSGRRLPSRPKLLQKYFKK